MLSNKVDEIGVKLGMRNRDKSSGESISKYMGLINSLLKENFNITLIEIELIGNIKIIEPQFIERKGDIPMDYIKEVFNIYFDLKKLDIPNCYEQIEWNSPTSNSALYTLYSSNNHTKRKNKSDKLKVLLLHNLKEEEYSLQKQLDKKYDRALFERAVGLRQVKDAIEKKDKVEISGSLKDNISYQRTLEDLLGYSFIGAFLLFFLIGIIITIEAVLFPSLTGSLSILLLLSFGTSTLFFIIYWNYFWRQSN